jgi:hypothetical protein
MELLSLARQHSKGYCEQHGQILLTQAQMKAAMYLGRTKGTTKIMMSYITHCLQRLIMDEIFAKVSTNASRYQFVVQPDLIPIIDGPCFPNVTFNDTYVSTKATTEMA